MNKLILMGRLGSDAELKMTQGGQSVCKFSLATSEKWTDKQGVKQEKTQWHRCTMWGERGAKLAQYLTKGKQLLVEGSVEYSSYEKDGEKRYTTDIRVNNVEFAGDGGNKKSQVEPEAPLDNTDIGGDNDIPF